MKSPNQALQRTAAGQRGCKARLVATVAEGCIRFKRLTDLNLSAVEDILREILKLRKQGIGPSCR